MILDVNCFTVADFRPTDRSYCHSKSDRLIRSIDKNLILVRCVNVCCNPVGALIIDPLEGGRDDPFHHGIQLFAVYLSF